MRALLINPYTYDFAAYNFWSAPIGPLRVGAILRQNGFEVYLIDCMKVREEKRKDDGRAPFITQRVQVPPPLSGIQKTFSRYGFSRDELAQALLHVPKPDIVLIGTLFTYWYLGPKEVSELVKSLFPKARVILGGLYVTLCRQHATRSFKACDLLVPHNAIWLLYEYIAREFSIKLPFTPSAFDLDSLPYPCFDLYPQIPFVPLVTSYGCPFRCTFCATPFLFPQTAQRSKGSLLDEVSHWHTLGVEKFVLYDDAFLYRKEVHAKPILRALSDLPFKLQLFNPNALHARMIDEETAFLLRTAGFREVRLGLEGLPRLISPHTDGKLAERDFERAIDYLKRAGFPDDSITAYLLVGLPFQHWKEVKHAIDYAATFHIRIELAEYSPIPQTPLFDAFRTHARYPIEAEPLFQNNTLFPFSWEGFTEEHLSFLKAYARDRSA